MYPDRMDQNTWWQNIFKLEIQALKKEIYQPLKNVKINVTMAMRFTITVIIICLDMCKPT